MFDTKAWRVAHKDDIRIFGKAWRDAKRATGLCTVCGKEPALKDRMHGAKCTAYHNAYARANPKRNAESKRRSQAKLRLQVLAAYGGKCACCGESNEVFLAIDHVDGNGRAHRREVGQTAIFWLRRNNYPSGFQVLCHNCNYAKYREGQCPHTIS